MELASTPYDSVRESKTFQEIQKQLADNFAERIQLKKSLIELEDTNFANRMEVERIEKLLTTYVERRREVNCFRMDDKDDSTAEELSRLSSECATIKDNIQENIQYKAQIEKVTFYPAPF